MNQRSRLLVAVGAAGAVAAVVGFFVVAQHSRDAATSRLLVDLGLLVVLAGAVVALTRPPSGTTDEIIDALRALGRWQRNVRLEPERFGELGEVARTYNDVAAALSERDDPNLGAVKTRRRRAPAPPYGDDEPGLGEVRVLKRGSEPPEKAKSEPPEKADSEPPEDVDSEPPEKADSEPPEKADSEPPEDVDREPPEPTEEEIRAGRETSPARPAARRGPPAPDNDTTIDAAPLEPGSEPEASSEEEPEELAPVPPLDLKALFQEFVEAKRAHDEDTTDLEYESFRDTIEDESARLKDAHQCRAVRFEVRVQDGEVSLLPRLLR